MLKKPATCKKAVSGYGQRVHAAVRREQARLISKIFEDKISELELGGIQSELGTVELNPITSQLDIETLKLD